MLRWRLRISWEHPLVNVEIPSCQKKTKQTQDRRAGLGWWESSSGRALESRRVIVRTRRRWDTAEVLIVPV